MTTPRIPGRIATLLLVFLCMTGTGQAFDTTEPFENLILFDAEGEVVGTYHLDQYTDQVILNSTDFEVTTSTFPNGPTEPPVKNVRTVPVGSSTAAVPNALQSSYPTPSSGVPQVALFSFDSASMTGTKAPGLSVTPSPGIYHETIVLNVQAFPSTATLQYRTAGETTWKTAGNSVDMFIYTNTALEFQAVSSTLATSAVKSVSYTIIRDDNKHPEMVDSDHDGYPDGWEIANGLNPLECDIDTDKDGMSDADEILRGSDPLSAASLPVDSDGDGWSDFDEDLRSTGKLAPNSTPAARRLYEVERCISGNIYSDNAGTAPVSPSPFGLLSFASDPLPLGTTPCSGATYLIDPVKPSLKTLTNPLSTTTTTSSLGSYGPHRLPVGEPALLRLSEETGGLGKVLAIKRYIPITKDITPLQLMADQSWKSAEEWEELYLIRLKASLVESVTGFNVIPENSYPFAILERELEILASIPPGVYILLGSSTNPATPAVLQQFEDLLSHKNIDLAELPLNIPAQDMNDHFDELNTLLGHAATAISLVKDSDAIFAALTADMEHNSEFQLGALYQGQPGRYLAGLSLAYSNGYLENQLTESSWAELLDAAGDLDKDSIANSSEVPGDSLDKSSLFLSDSDADGVGDSIDNCPTVYNPGQSDFDGDGQGNSCDADDDNDGLDDNVELVFGSNPYDTDTNDDGESDLEEWNSNQSPGTLVTITVKTPTLDADQIVTGRRASGSVITLSIDTAATTGTVQYPTSITWQAPVSGLVYGDNNITVSADGGKGSSYATVYRARDFLPGDTNRDNSIDLVDAILVLQLLTGSETPAGVTIDLRIDINGDGKIGMEELLFILNQLM